MALAPSSASSVAASFVKHVEELDFHSHVEAVWHSPLAVSVEHSTESSASSASVALAPSSASSVAVLVRHVEVLDFHSHVVAV